MEPSNQLEISRTAGQWLQPVYPGELAPVHDVQYQPGLNLASSWGILRKHRWAILLIFTVIGGAVAAWTFSQTPLYRAQGLLEIEKEAPHILTPQDLFALDSVSDVYLETQYRILESDSLAERVIQELNLGDAPEFKRGTKRFWQNDPPKAESWLTLEIFRDRLQITPIRHSRLVQISFDSQDPALAVQVVNAFVADYIDENTQARWNDAQKAAKWLYRQLAVVRKNLQESEQKLQSYARSRNLLLPEVGGGGNEALVSDRLRKVQEELVKAQADRKDRESLYRLVQTGDYSSLPGTLENKVVQDLSVQLADLQKQLAQLKTTFSPQYFKVKEVQNQIAEIDSALNRERNRAAQRITQDYNAAVYRENLARHDFEAESKQANVVGERLTRYNALKLDAEADRKLYDELLQRVKQAAFSGQATEIRVVDPAKAGHAAVKPNVALNLPLGALLGLVLGVGFAFVRENLNNTITNPEQLEGCLSLRTLASVPTVGSLSEAACTYRPTGTSSLVRNPFRVSSRAKGNAVLSEAFRRLSTSMVFSDAGRVPSSILVTSAQPGEGKTVVAANLAIALAELGEPVLLIDADMRRPKLHRIFGLQYGESGLAGYLDGKFEWSAAIQKTMVEYLDVMRCGKEDSNPVRLLSSDRVPRLLAEAGKRYKYIVFDSPPVLNVADGRILAHLVEGVLLVVKSSSSPIVLIQRAEAYIRGAGAKIIGVVLNNFNLADDIHYHGRYNPLYYALKPRDR